MREERGMREGERNEGGRERKGGREAGRRKMVKLEEIHFSLNLHGMRRPVYPYELIRRFCVTNKSGSVTTTSVEFENWWTCCFKKHIVQVCMTSLIDARDAAIFPL